jgi:hypothetical protein
MKYIYKIPVCIATIHLFSFHPSVKCKCMKIDEIGAYVYYLEEKDLDEKNICKYLVGVIKKNWIAEAESLKNAIDLFYAKWEGARIGGKKETQKAAWIEKEKAILEIPHCGILNKTKNGEYICGELDEDGWGIFGGCRLDGGEGVEMCPVSRFEDVFFEEKEVDKIRGEVNKGGTREYSVVTADSLGISRLIESLCKTTRSFATG